MSKIYYKGIILLVIVPLFFTAFRWPVDSGKITSTFAEARPDHFHDGVDMISGNGKVYPVSEGELLYYFNKVDYPFDNYPGGGNFAVVKHTNGYYSVYMHLIDGFKDFSTCNELTPISLMSDTGRTLARHIHFTVLGNDKLTSINPYQIMPVISDLKGPEISNFFLRLPDNSYFVIKDKGNFRITQNFPLLIDITDKIDGKERLGIYRLKVEFNGNKVFDLNYESLKSTQNGLTINNQHFNQLFDEKGYYKVTGIVYISGLNNLSVTAYDYAGNSTVKSISFNVQADIISE